MNHAVMVLYRIGLRTFLGSIVFYLVGSVAYVFLLLWLYPSIAQAPGLQALLHALPKSLIAATGITAGLSSPLAYLVSEFYSMLYLWILMIFTVLGIHRLLAQGPSRGFAGPWLSGPVTRRDWVVSQGLVWLTGLVLIILAVTIATVVAMATWEANTKLSFHVLFALNGLIFLLFVALSGLVALCAVGFSDDQRGLSASASIVTVEYVLSLVSGLAPHLRWLSDVTFFSLYRPSVIVTTHSHNYGTEQAILLILAAACFWGVALWLFSRRDLQL